MSHPCWSHAELSAPDGTACRRGELEMQMISPCHVGRAEATPSEHKGLKAPCNVSPVERAPTALKQTTKYLHKFEKQTRISHTHTRTERETKKKNYRGHSDS